MRPEWVGDGSQAAPPDERVLDATLQDFAYDATATLLATEPRLRTIATLVERAGPLDAVTWREVGVLAATFVGQGRRVPQIGAVTGETVSVAPLLNGEITRQRYMAALRDLTGQT
jgi:hypothetical protein